MNINKKTITDSGAFTAGALAGAIGSRVANDKLTKIIEKPMLRHGAIAILGLAFAAFATPKDIPGKLMQGAGVGMAATQLNELIKNVATDNGKKPMDDGILKTGLGAPETVYIATTPSYEYYPYENVQDTTTTTAGFLSAPSQFQEV